MCGGTTAITDKQRREKGAKRREADLAKRRAGGRGKWESSSEYKARRKREAYEARGGYKRAELGCGGFVLLFAVAVVGGLLLGTRVAGPAFWAWIGV